MIGKDVGVPEVVLRRRPQRNPDVASGFAISVVSRLKTISVRHVQIGFAQRPWLGRSERTRAKSEERPSRAHVNGRAAEHITISKPRPCQVSNARKEEQSS